MKYILFGTGDYYERYKKWFDNKDVLALMDNDSKKKNALIDGHIVMDPKDALRLNYDRIVILSFYYLEMKEQLLTLGVSENKIFHFYDLFKLLPDNMIKREIRYWETANNNYKVSGLKNRILLLSQDLSLGGPALALMHVALVLQNNGYEVIYGSMIDGPLREQLLEKSISVIVDENLQWESLADTNWVQKFDLLICNTINYYTFLREITENIPIIWWLHDSDFFYGGVDKRILCSIDLKNVKVVSVGKVPREAMNKYRPDIIIGELLYGVTEV